MAPGSGVILQILLQRTIGYQNSDNPLVQLPLVLFTLWNILNAIPCPPTHMSSRWGFHIDCVPVLPLLLCFPMLCKIKSHNLQRSLFSLHSITTTLAKLFPPSIIIVFIPYPMSSHKSKCISNIFFIYHDMSWYTTPRDAESKLLLNSNPGNCSTFTFHTGVIHHK